MILRDEHSTLRLTLAPDVEQGGFDDVHLVAEVFTGGFVGRNASVWASRPVWDAFLGNLHALARTRSGEARLISMSPADLEIRVHVYDRAGHVRVNGHVGDDVIWSDLTEVARVPFRIEVDPSTIVELVAAFEQLVTSGQRTAPEQQGLED